MSRSVAAAPRSEYFRLLAASAGKADENRVHVLTFRKVILLISKLPTSLTFGPTISDGFSFHLTHSTMHPKLFIASLVLLIASTCHVTAASTKKVPQTQYYAITGTHTGVNSQTGARPARRNIDDLQKDTPSW